MEEKHIKVAVIACGGRSQYVVGNLLRDSHRNVEIVSTYDPDPAQMERACEHWKTPETLRCKSSQEAIHAPGVEWVMVFSPNAYHKQYILEGFAAGKHVFSEKPLATTVEDAKSIYDAYRQSGLLFATGFVLRYGKIYRKLKELLASGHFGRILSVDANEHITPGHGGYIQCNWRRQSAISGPHILEKCCHDLDLLIWMCESLPAKVMAFGANDLFRSEYAYLEKKVGRELFHEWPDPHGIETPFNDDSDMMDNLISIAEFRNGIRVSFNATMCNPIPERRMYFHCTEGNVEVELYSQRLAYQKLGDREKTIIEYKGDGHAGGDDFIMKELYETMCTGKEPACSGSEGLESAVYALAIDEAARTKQIVDVEKTWQKLGR